MPSTVVIVVENEKLFHSLLFFFAGASASLSACACAHYMHCDLVILLAAIISSFAYVLLCINTYSHSH